MIECQYLLACYARSKRENSVKTGKCVDGKVIRVLKLDKIIDNLDAWPNEHKNINLILNWSSFETTIYDLPRLWHIT